MRSDVALALLMKLKRSDWGAVERRRDMSSVANETGMDEVRLTRIEMTKLPSAALDAAACGVVIAFAASASCAVRVLTDDTVTLLT